MLYRIHIKRKQKQTGNPKIKIKNKHLQKRISVFTLIPCDRFQHYIKH